MPKTWMAASWRAQESRCEATSLLKCTGGSEGKTPFCPVVPAQLDPLCRDVQIDPFQCGPAAATKQAWRPSFCNTCCSLIGSQSSCAVKRRLHAWWTWLHVMQELYTRSSRSMAQFKDLLPTSTNDQIEHAVGMLLTCNPWRQVASTGVGGGAPVCYCTG